MVRCAVCLLTGIKTQHGMLQWGKEALPSRLTYCYLSLPRNTNMLPSGLKWDFYYKSRLIATGSQDAMSPVGLMLLTHWSKCHFSHWTPNKLSYYLEFPQTKPFAVAFPRCFQNMMLINAPSKLLQSCKALQGLTESKKHSNSNYRVFEAPLV